MAHVEVRGSRIFKSTLVSQLNGKPTLSKDTLTRIKARMSYTNLNSLPPQNHDTMLNLGCDCRVCFLNTHEARFIKK